MKKTITAACALSCAVLLCACTIGQNGQTNMEGASWESMRSSAIISEQTTELTDIPTDSSQQIETSTDAKPETEQDSETTQNGQNMAGAQETQCLMQGYLGNIGSGFLVCILPEQDYKDYNLCFFKTADETNELNTPLSDLDFSLEEANYIFPDVRENNASIGKFVEIYFSELITIGEDGTDGLAVIAIYTENGKTYYDTRIYKWDGTKYSAEEKLIQEFNEKYRTSTEYPVEALYHL